MKKKEKFFAIFGVLLFVGLFLFIFKGSFSIYNNEVEFDKFGYHWICSGNVGGTNLDDDLSDYGISSYAQPVYSSSGTSYQGSGNTKIDLSSGISLISKGYGIGGLFSGISCRTTNFTLGNVESVNILSSGSLGVQGNGQCSADINRIVKSQTMTCPNYPFSNSISFSNMEIKKLAGKWILSDGISTKEFSENEQLQFSVSTSIDGGKTYPSSEFTINNIQITYKNNLSEQISKLEGTLQEKIDYINSLSSSIEEKAYIIKNLELTQQEQATLISNLNLNIEEQVVIIKVLSTKVEEQAQLINLLTNNLQLKAQYVSQLTVENEKQAELIKDMQLSFENQAVIVSNLNNTISEDIFIIRDLTTNINEQAILVNNLEKTTEEKQQIIMNLSDTIEQQKALIAKYESEKQKTNTNYTLIILGIIIGFGLILFFVKMKK